MDLLQRSYMKKKGQLGVVVLFCKYIVVAKVVANIIHAFPTVC